MSSTKTKRSATSTVVVEAPAAGVKKSRTQSPAPRVAKAASGAGASAAPKAATVSAAVSAKAANDFFERFAVCMRHASTVAGPDAPFRQLYQRHVLLGMLEEEVTGINCDVTAPSSKDMVVSSLESMSTPENQARLKKVIEKEGVSTFRRGAAQLLSELVKGDVTKEHDDTLVDE